MYLPRSNSAETDNIIMLSWIYSTGNVIYGIFSTTGKSIFDVYPFGLSAAAVTAAAFMRTATYCM